MILPRIVLCAAVVLGHGALADEPPPAPAKVEVSPPASPERETTIQPKPSEKPPLGRTRFQAEPIRDGAIVAISMGFAGLLELVNSTGEVQPQQISKTFDTHDLLFFDRPAVTQTFDTHASLYSNFGLIALISYAIADPIATGFRESSVQAAIVDGIIYAESLAVTLAATNMAKIAVRRPRPLAYKEADAHKDDPNYVNTNTDTSLSFFSGHASISAAATATATYLAFARSPHSIRPWLTLLVGTAVTTFVCTERVRSGAHFPSDVIAGVMAGAGIGVLVPHYHRSETAKQRPLWIGYTPEPGGGAGGVLSLSGQF